MHFDVYLQAKLSLSHVHGSAIIIEECMYWTLITNAPILSVYIHDTLYNTGVHFTIHSVFGIGIFVWLSLG